VTAAEPRFPFARPPGKALSPLEAVLQLERRDLTDMLGRVVMRTCRCGLADAKDVVQIAMMSAIARERKGNGWNPAGEMTIEQYMLQRVFNALKNRYRTARRKPATPAGDAAEVASAMPGGLAGLVASAADADDELQALRKLAADLVRHFEEETGGRIPLAIMDHHLRGVHEYDRIAESLKCSPHDVRAGWSRLKRHGAKLAAAARGKGDAS
jgi:DNA-directed RNA polymerase specialized sigma24 family protein